MSSTKQALEQAEAEKRRRREEKIAKGEAIRLLPVVVGYSCAAEKEKERRIAALRAGGETREVIFGEALTEDGPAPIGVIVTGVPRPHRDGDARCENCNCMPAAPKFDSSEYERRLQRHSEPSPRPVPTPPAMPEPPREWWPFRVQIRAGNGGSDPGAIIEGRYGVNGDFVFVEDDQGKPVDMQRLGPNENAAAVAQKVLREKWHGKSQVPGFYDGPINRRTFH